MQEQPPTQPDAPAPMPTPTTGPLAAPAPAAPAPPARRSGAGCVGRLLSALLVVIITTFLALVAGATGLLYLGFTPTIPQQLAAAQIQVGTLQAANSQLQTQVAATEARGSGDHELLGELKSQVDAMADLRNQLRQEREASAAQSATLVAEVRNGRDAVALFATAEAGRAALIAELERRSARVERFLDRLGDIASDTATDLGGTTPVIPTLTFTPTPAAQPSATPTPAASEIPAPTATVRATPRPSPTPTAARATDTPTPGS